MLEMLDVAKLLENLMTLMEGEVDILEMEKKIRGRVKKQMKPKSQKAEAQMKPKSQRPEGQRSPNRKDPKPK